VGYDIIGDIHGYADKLEGLLSKLGYQNVAGSWRHPDRQAIFVGDFVDLGPAQLRSFDTMRRMVDAGAALAVMGNHELNAIAWHTPDPDHPGEYLRPHFSARWGEKNRKQHAAFLAEVENKPELHAEVIDCSSPSLSGWICRNYGWCMLVGTHHS
jgi:calcineurin-like phosphoesterase family protein